MHACMYACIHVCMYVGLPGIHRIGLGKNIIFYEIASGQRVM